MISPQAWHELRPDHGPFHGEELGVVTTLYDSLRPEIESFIRRRVADAEVAEDLTQEAFLRLTRESIRRGLPLEPKHWLYRVAGNRAISHGRRVSVARRRTAALPGEGRGDQPADIVI